MKARVLAGTQPDYERFVTTTAHTDLGRAEFQGVCATCHGMQGQGGYGPALSQNPILTQPSALESIVRNGRNKMPPVGDTWTAEQIAGAVGLRQQEHLQGSDEWRLGRMRLPP